MTNNAVIGDTGSSSRSEGVALIVVCYEKTFRKVLTVEYFQRIAEQCDLEFHSRIVVINNVLDRSSVQSLAESVRVSGGFDEYYFVSDHLVSALRDVGLRTKDLGRIPQYSAGVIVGIHMCRASYLLDWDADVNLSASHDWITPSLRRLKADPSLFAANPLWNPQHWSMDVIRSESLQEDDEFFMGYGFSDQLFLARTEELRQPIYNFHHPFSLRYPLSHIATVFEQRIDSYMRHNQRFRLTYKAVGYTHPLDTEGQSHPAPTAWERARRLVHRNRVRVARQAGNK